MSARTLAIVLSVAGITLSVAGIILASMAIGAAL